MKKLLIIILLFSVIDALYAQSKEDLKKQKKALEEKVENLDEQNKLIKEIEKLQNELKKRDDEKYDNSLPKVKFDFRSRSYITIPKKIRKGEFYQIQIDSINLNQYRLEIESSDTVYNTALNFPTFGTLDLSTLSGLVSSLVVESSYQKEIEEVVEALDKVSLTEGTKINTSFNLFETYSDKPIKDLQDEIDAQEKVKNTRKEIEARVALVKAQTTKFEAKLKLAKDAIENKKFDYMTYRILRQTGEQADGYKPNVRSDLEDFEEYRNELKGLKRRVETEIKSLAEFAERSEIKVFLNNDENIDLKDKVEKSKKTLAEANSKTSKAISLISTENVGKQFKSILNLYQTNSYTSMPIQYNGGKAEVRIKFIPKDSTSGLQSETLPPVRFPKRGFYWSVGPSVYFSGLSNERIGIETIQVSDSTSRYSLLRESELKNEIGASVLLRSGYKWDSGFGLHSSVGTGLSLGEEVKPRLLYGLGISLGHTHNLSIDFGGIAGYVKRVSDNADFDREYPEKPSLIINELKGSWFVSAGYIIRF
ncbi:hypothetical protein [Rhodohalobacter sulfatireducens]|uniref:Outer membrane protein beta-barrel domain-containing protein n=1 Tax=Rhodohalobacter sulfatireducens TaxID=2911366 RepID=A0ABS9KF81_9BACT|nr:hypothetical protein [Rhodohalobacter sulfatireducens]MCG2589517.1 hypothetical protein [Rhodohalobacter sulfatireducens]